MAQERRPCGTNFALIQLKNKQGYPAPPSVRLHGKQKCVLAFRIANKGSTLAGFSIQACKSCFTSTHRTNPDVLRHLKGIQCIPTTCQLTELVGNGLQLSIGSNSLQLVLLQNGLVRNAVLMIEGLATLFSDTSLFSKSCPTKPVKPKTNTKSQSTPITTPIPTQSKTTSRQLEDTVTN